MSDLKNKNIEINEMQTVQNTAVKMQEYYAKNKAYRPKDLQYVLGDPIRGVEITMDGACTPKRWV